MKLRVATFNVWALPWGLSRHTDARLGALAEALPGLELDVAAFQEVWTEEARGQLLEAAPRAGFPHHWHNRGGLGNSGLLVLSRLPIAEARFDPYRLRGRPERIWQGDYWGGKGFALLGLETPEGPLAFVDTHLHAQYAEGPRGGYAAERMGQVVQLAAGLAGVSVPLVVAGDLNLREDQRHYGALAGLAGLRDAAVEAGAAQPTVLGSNPYRAARPRADARIDYLMLRDGPSHALRVRSVERILDGPLTIEGEAATYSDHAGVLAELELRAQRVTPRPRPTPEALAVGRGLLEEGSGQSARRRTRRLGAGVAAATVGVGALAAPRLEPVSRRRFLTGLLTAGGLLAVPGGVAVGGLGELSGRSEARAYRETLASLDELAAMLPPSR